MSSGTMARRAGAAVLALTLGGCGTQLGGLGEILGGVLGGGGQSSRPLVEIQQVDTRRQAIHVRTEDGRTGAVRYDRNTQVIYRQQQYPVTALERGDVAYLEVQETGGGELYASRVLVHQSVQERSGQTAGSGAGTVGRLEAFSGRVVQIHPQVGSFELQTSGGTVTVSLPANASSAAVQRFRTLRSGETVRVEGSWLTAGTIELYRFL
jgi:hypothetical protein